MTAPDARARSTPAAWALAAFGWGLAEATLFFVVPDVLISFAGLRSARRATVTALLAVAGALVGGAVMWWFGAHRPAGTLALLARIPGISESMVRAVGHRTGELGLVAVLTGPARGIPYKIYATQWGVGGGALAPFLFASVAARIPRFLMLGYAARGIARLASRGGDAARRRWLDVGVGSAWALFYCCYLAFIAPAAAA